MSGVRAFPPLGDPRGRPSKRSSVPRSPSRRRHTMTLNRITRSATLGLALIALGAPVAGARVDTPFASSQPIAVAQDLRSPDARDAAKATNAKAAVDLRSPDARDGYVFARSPSVSLRSAEPVDLRTPDAVDAGRPISSTPASAVADT